MYLLIVPPFMRDEKIKKFINRLMNKIPEARLGGSFASVKADPYFDNFDWVLLFIIIIFLI